MLEWVKVSTQKEYLRTGLMRSSGYHIASTFFLFLLSSFGKPSPVRYWRYILLVIFFATELGLVLHPSPSSYSSIFDAASSKTWLDVIFPQRVAFQHILFLHQLFVFVSYALTNVAPVLFPDESVPPGETVLAKLNALVGVADREGGSFEWTISF